MDETQLHSILVNALAVLGAWILAISGFVARWGFKEWRGKRNNGFNRRASDGGPGAQSAALESRCNEHSRLIASIDRKNAEGFLQIDRKITEVARQMDKKISEAKKELWTKLSELNDKIVVLWSERR